MSKICQYVFLSELSTPHHLSKTLPHDVDVVYIQKRELCILVALLVLVAPALRHVRHGVHLWSRVEDVDFVRLGVRVHYVLAEMVLKNVQITLD